MTETILLRTRNTAMIVPDFITRVRMKENADRLSIALAKLACSPTNESLASVNGLWAACERDLKNAKIGGDDAPSGGAFKEGARLAA